MRLLVWLSLCLLLAGCRGKLISSAELLPAGGTDFEFQATGETLELWADSNAEWREASASGHGRFPAHFEIDFFSKTTALGHASCDSETATNAKCSFGLSVGDLQRGDCEVKLACPVPAIPAGATTMHVVTTLGKGVSIVSRLALNLRVK